MMLILVVALMLLGAAGYVTSERALAPARRRREMLDQTRPRRRGTRRGAGLRIGSQTAC